MLHVLHAWLFLGSVTRLELLPPTYGVTLLEFPSLEAPSCIHRANL